MALLKKYSYPNQLKNKNPETLAKYLMKETCHHYNETINEANKIILYVGLFDGQIFCLLIKKQKRNIIKN